jgi:hypothetical protein
MVANKCLPLYENGGVWEDIVDNAWVPSLRQTKGEKQS